MKVVIKVVTKKLILFSLLLGAIQSSHADDDQPAFHGMLIFGKSTIYLSHLPMFHQPHDYQAIVEVSLQSQDQQTYLQDQISHPEQTLYTIAPLENFVLQDEVMHLKAFHATLYRGHFERGGVPIAKDVVVQITRVVYFSHFDPGAVKPAALTYLLFGHPEEGEMFMAHWIVAKPDFDQVAEVELNMTQDILGVRKSSYCFVRGIGQADDQPFEGNPIGFQSPFQFSEDCTNQVLQLTSFKEIYLELGDLSN
jgi:hypothetical protein